MRLMRNKGVGGNFDIIMPKNCRNFFIQSFLK